MPTPIPPLLDAYVQPQARGSLTLVSSVHNATSNWLLLRLIYAALNGRRKAAKPYGVDSTGGLEVQRERANVVFISFLRNFTFWQNEGKRIGLDIPSMVAQKRLTFIDGLSQLFLPEPRSTSSVSRNNSVSPWIYSSIRDLQEHLSSQITLLAGASSDTTDQGTKTVLILDALDLLIATTAGAPHNVSASQVINMCLTLRSRPEVDSMIVALNGDQPFSHPSPHPTPLETEQRTLLLMMAHQARLVLQLRSLDTGSAKDVSGVLRASRGGAWEDNEEEISLEEASKLSSSIHGTLEEREWLYHIAGNAEAKVWGRGETGLS